VIRSMQNGKSKRRVLAIVVPLLLATIIVGGVGLGIAQTVLTLLKPSIFDVQAKAVPVTVTSLKFLNLDPKTKTYSNLQVALQNNDNANSYTVNVYVTLYDSSGNTVASGSYTGVALGTGASATISVPLTWSTGKTVADVATGSIIVEPA